MLIRDSKFSAQCSAILTLPKSASSSVPTAAFKRNWLTR